MERCDYCNKECAEREMIEDGAEIRMVCEECAEEIAQAQDEEE